MDLHQTAVDAIRTWAAGNENVAEVWLFGSRAKGTARPDSDVDLALVLVPGAPGDPGHDWPEGNYQALGDRWEADLTDVIQHDVHLKRFARPGEKESANAASAKATAVLLWSRGG
ncbi:nucleotidyltransferase domain-containing protein [Methylobacterium sp. J-030]|uniref:nucleotidyltransferase domain-containing protein n=1 Tax=Methylobacterium sp. J-030 TaxID=2836627 RepID=UPI001FB8A408|nr:nucleotidyltransferase domain-containing protein [Methylobacterium sp. J-030]MCJ2068147.1 nucleotidyltransferase domain-containing protein [Methylobacterium sp. J-030]